VRSTRSVVALALALAVSGAAWGQTRAEFTDQQIESFVVGALAVDKLIREWSPRIQGAKDAEHAAQLRDQASAELVETIERTEGLTLEQYQDIGRAAQNDPELAARINEAYRDRAGNN
jgi:hypothetical protein